MLHHQTTRLLLVSSGLPWRCSAAPAAIVPGVLLRGHGLQQQQHHKQSLYVDALRNPTSQFSTFSSMRSAMQTFSQGEHALSFAARLRLSLEDKLRSITITANPSSSDAVAHSCFKARLLSSHTTFTSFSPQLKNNNIDNEVFFLFRDLSSKSSLFGGAYLRDKMHYQQLLSLKQNRRGYYGGGGSSRSSGWFSITPSQITWGIIGLNACVFLAWQYAKENYDYQMINFLRNNFTLSWENLMKGRLWTLITFNFSHIDGFHIFMNSLNFYFFAPTIIALLGPKRFVWFGLLAMLSTAAAELGHELYVAAKYNDYRNTYALGLSGCNNAIMFLFACFFPSTPIHIWGVLPIPSLLFIGGWTAYELYETLYNKRSGISHAGHLGGGAAGILTYLFLRFGLRR